jgi:hypothetical protein
MNGVLVLAAVAAMGIEVGWQPLPGGGHEYTIQIEPDLLRVLEGGGEELASEVPPGINIRRYRVTVGTGTLVREAGEPPPPVEPPREPAADPADPLGQAPEAPPPTADESPAKDAADSTFAPAEGDAAHDAAPPEKLPPQRDAGPIQPANYDETPPSGDAAARGEETLNKPMLTGGEPNRPWPVLLGSVALLCVSLGANIYLGWIAMQARQKYRDAVGRFGTS